MPPSVLIIDNYDSFTYNLKHTLQITGAQVDVLFNDAPRLVELAGAYDALVLSPGPSRPDNSGLSAQVFLNYYRKKPVLGVCLGMQIMNEALGGTTVRAPEPVHGKTALVTRTGDSRLLRGLPPAFSAARYHSLVCDDVPAEFAVTARRSEVIMAVEHSGLPVFGVQFHPESFLTEHGQTIIENFVQSI